jgi:hypothetical protein
MSDSSAVAVAVEFMDRLNAGEVADVRGVRVDIDEVVVDGCIVAMFGSAGGATNGAAPVACRVVVEEGVVTDWVLYGVDAASARLRSRTRNARPETMPARPPK